MKLLEIYDAVFYDNTCEEQMFGNDDMAMGLPCKY